MPPGLIVGVALSGLFGSYPETYDSIIGALANRELLRVRHARRPSIP